jgi:hypothetical protein
MCQSIHALSIQKKGGENMPATYLESTREKARFLGGWNKTAAQRAVDIIFEMSEHPERFCKICRKRKGVCEHKGDKKKW